jgi:hypothetical protein
VKAIPTPCSPASADFLMIPPGVQIDYIGLASFLENSAEAVRTEDRH